MQVTLNLYGFETQLHLTVVGDFELFPTWSPRSGPLFVINMDYLLARVGVDLPMQVWFKVQPGANMDAVTRAIYVINPFSAIQPLFYRGLIAEQERPVRQGVLGLLSVGFVVTSALAMISYVLYMIFGFRRRAIELGTLRAIGLTVGQLAWCMAWELLLLVSMSLLLGTGLGVFVSKLWIPYYRLDDAGLSDVLPMSVEIPWATLLDVYVIFGVLFLLLLVISIVLARRVRLYQAVKLAEAF